MFYDILLLIFYYLDEYDLLRCDSVSQMATTHRQRINFVKAVRQTGDDSN